MNAAVGKPVLQLREPSVPGSLKYLVLKQQIAFDSYVRKD